MNLIDNLTQMEAAILYGVFQYCRSAARHHGYYEPEFNDPNWFGHFQPKPNGRPMPTGFPECPAIPPFRFETELRFVSNEIIDYMPPTYVEGLKAAKEHVAKLVYEGLLLLQKREMCEVADPDMPRPKLNILTPEEAEEFRKSHPEFTGAPMGTEFAEVSEGDFIALPVGMAAAMAEEPTQEQQSRMDDKYEQVRVDFKGRVFFQN